MTMPRRQLVLLAVLAVVAVAGYMTFAGDDTPAGSTGRPSNRQGQGGEALPDAPVVNLGLDRLQAEREHLPESTRDPFRFRPKAPPPAPPRAAAAPKPPEFLPPAAPPIPAGPPPPPPITVKFFGLVVLRGERVATF